MFSQNKRGFIQKEREAFEAWLKSLNENGRTTYFLGQESTVAWEAWQAAKAQAVPEEGAVINKLSDQLYAQEMKTSAARVLCETACELLDDYAHQDAMVILNDLEQAMKEPAND